MSVPVTPGSGGASVASELIGTQQYQQIKVIGAETGSTSTMGVNPDRSINVSVLGTVPVTGSVLVVGSPSISGAITVSGSVLLGSSNASVITRWADSSVIAVATGSVVAVPTGNQSVSGAVNIGGSVLLGSSNASIITRSQDSSIIAITTGSVATVFQGSVITVWKDSSVLAVPVGSVITVWTSPSIVGTYAEDAASASADKGVFVLGVRNDTNASLVSADKDYGAFATDSAGRMVTKPFSPEESRVEGYNSVVSTSVTTLVAAPGAGLKNYITDIQIANTGATTTLVTFKSGGGTSVLGYTIAPTGGGSNITLQTPMRTLANETFDFQATTSTSVLFATVKGYKAP